MSGGREGTPWPEPGQKAPFTWGTPSDGSSFTWGAPSGGPTLAEVRYATWGRRGVAFLLDFLLMASAPVAFFVLLGASVPDSSNPNAPFSAISWVWFWCLAASSTLFVLYPVWFIGQRGQTPGMKQMQIRLLQIEGGEGNLAAPGWPRAWGRAVVATAGWFLFFAWILDYLWPLGDKRHQCIHDKAVGTVAVDLRTEGGSRDNHG